MLKIIYYEAIDAVNMNELCKYVAERIAQGLQPLGNPTGYFVPHVCDSEGTITIPGVTRYVQAMVKYEV